MVSIRSPFLPTAGPGPGVRTWNCDPAEQTGASPTKAIWRHSPPLPRVYAPRFGGHDPVAAVRGAATPGHPDLWLIADDQLYLFYSEEARAAFARDPDSVIEAAERHWPDIVRGTPR